MKKAMLGLALCLGGLSMAAENDRLVDPYAICAHVSRGELAVANDEFKRLSEIPVNWVRTDYDWGGVEKSQGTWNFSHLDKLLSLSKTAKVNVLPILDYDVPWAKPAYQNLDKWCEYVQRTVSRYAADIRYWEVWNEQNGFWPRPARGEDYAPLLKRSYETIKAIDPQLQVLYGGTAGVPLAYIEATFKAGAAQYFDIMNVHPYNWQGTPEDMLPQLKGLKAVMDKYGVGSKPIWITEVGWSTANQAHITDDAFIAAFKHLGIEANKHPLALVNDARMGGASVRYTTFGDKYFTRQQLVNLDQIAGLDPRQYPVLVPTKGESFPAKYHDALRSYLNKGGTIILPSGLPFYYDLQHDQHGATRSVQVNDRDVASFHIAWTSWWTHKGVPENMTFQQTAPQFKDILNVNWKGNKSVRFLDNRNLKPGDEMIPVVLAGDKDYTAPSIALYKLNSDLKGNIIVQSCISANECVSAAAQAENLPRTYILAFAYGVDRVFWYNFRSWEGDSTEREHHFGIVHRDLTPKPSFYTYQALTARLPSGSTRPVLKVTDDIYQATWQRPDGTNVCAVWTAYNSIGCSLTASSPVVKAFDLNGKPFDFPANNTFKATPQVIYLEGPQDITIRPTIK